MSGGDLAVDEPFWGARIGSRISLRYRVPDPAPGDPPLTDVVGRLESVADDTLAVRREPRRGELTEPGLLTVPLRDVVAAKVVPPRPSRPAPPHRAVSITDLQRVAHHHWRAPVTQQRDGWLLRAAGGVTGRGNSALPLGPWDGDGALAASLEQVRDWYRGQGLPPLLQLAEPVAGGVPDDGGPAAAARVAATALGWHPVPGRSALALTAPTGRIPLAPLPAGYRAEARPDPDADWLAGHTDRGDPAAELALLTSTPDRHFVTVRDADGAVAAAARGTVADGWAWIGPVEVASAHRRRGLARLLLGEVARWGAALGARSFLLLVAEDNLPALQLYRSAGFEPHHRYDYFSPGAASDPTSDPTSGSASRSASTSA